MQKTDIQSLLDDLEKEQSETHAINMELREALKEVHALRKELKQESEYRKMSTVQKWKYNVGQASRDTNNEDPTSGPTTGAPDT
jgi:hypothetical protein